MRAALALLLATALPAQAITPKPPSVTQDAWEAYAKKHRKCCPSVWAGIKARIEKRPKVEPKRHRRRIA